MRTVRSRSASGDRDGCASADMVKALLRRCKHSTLEDLGSHITGFRYYVAMKLSLGDKGYGLPLHDGNDYCRCRARERERIWPQDLNPGSESASSSLRSKRFWSAGQAPPSGAGVANRVPAIAGRNHNENRGQHRKAEAHLPSFIVLVLSRAQVSHEGVVSHNSDG